MSKKIGTCSRKCKQYKGGKKVRTKSERKSCMKRCM